MTGWVINNALHVEIFLQLSEAVSDVGLGGLGAVVKGKKKQRA